MKREGAHHFDIGPVSSMLLYLTILISCYFTLIYHVSQIRYDLNKVKTIGDCCKYGEHLFYLSTSVYIVIGRKGSSLVLTFILLSFFTPLSP